MQATPNLEHVNWNQSFAMMLAKMWRNFITTVVNGHIGFGDGTIRDNIDGNWASVTAPVAPNSDFTITHNLGRIPVGYLVMTKDRACDVYTGSLAGTKTQITLRATVASAALKLFIFSLFIFVGTSKAQNSIQNDIAVFNSSGTVKVIPSALITVCTSTGSGIPCTPKASVCLNQSDVACVQPNPFNADLNGNFFFWVPAGTYVVSISGVGATGRLITYSVGGSGGGGGGTPGGSNTQIQYNNSSTFGGFGAFNNGTNAATFPGSVASGAAGGVAGAWLCPQGSLPSAVANNWLLSCPTAVNAGGVNWIGPNKTGNAAGGVVFGSASAPNVTLSQSGDSKHSLRGTAQVATISGGAVCLAADCPAGEYTLELHLNSTVSCGTPGPGTITPTITFTDDAGTKTNQALPLFVNGSTTIANTMALGNTTNQAANIPFNFWSTGVNPVTISLNYTACTVGTGTYSFSAEVIQKQ